MLHGPNAAHHTWPLDNNTSYNIATPINDDFHVNDGRGAEDGTGEPFDGHLAVDAVQPQLSDNLMISVKSISKQRNTVAVQLSAQLPTELGIELET
jgi:hypothetical protein